MPVIPIKTTMETNTVIFQKELENETEPKKGGFSFNLKNQKSSEVPNIFAFGFKTPPTYQLNKKAKETADSEKELGKELKDDLRRKEDDSVQQKDIEGEMRLRIEAKARAHEEQERKKQADQKREEERKALKQQQKEEIERKEKIEHQKKIIANVVRDVLNELVS